jgi:hypothetical protein
MNWLYVGGAAALGALAWWLWPSGEEEPSAPLEAKTAIDHLVAPGQRHLIPRTPQHAPMALRRLQVEGRAIPQARALYGALRQGQAPPQLVAAFQQATNADPDSRALIGPVPVTGIYDPRTAAALTMYTEDPVPAHESVPDVPVPTSPASILMTGIPGNAAASGSNLYVYLRSHGRDGSRALSQLIRRFQHSVNTDPKFPGPANQSGLPVLIVDPLRVTGLLDGRTLRALGIVIPRPRRI